MARTYSQIASLIDTKLQRAAGTLTSAGFLAAVNFALDQFCEEVDPIESTVITTLAPAVFDDVFSYVLPSSIRGEAITDIRPVVEIASGINNGWQRNSMPEFTQNKLGSKDSLRWAIENNAGVKTLKIFNKMLAGTPKSIALSTCDAYDANGTWTADTVNSDANTVATNTLNFFEGSGSVSFNATVAQSVNNLATIYNPSINTVDISGLQNAYLFFYVYLPSSVANVSSVSFVVGSDAASTPSTKTNYYTFTTSTQFGGAVIVQGKNLLGIPLSSAVATGSLDTAAIKYLELNINYTASQANMTGILLDAVYVREGVFYEMSYLSADIVSSATGTKKQYFTADDDTTLLSSDGEAAFIEYATGQIAPSIKDFESAQLYQVRGQRGLEEYKAKYPSPRRRFVRNWYN